MFGIGCGNHVEGGGVVARALDATAIADNAAESLEQGAEAMCFAAIVEGAGVDFAQCGGRTFGRRHGIA